MVLERGVQGASAEYGHVAIVTTTADPDGRFRVHQMNVGGPYVEGDGRYRRGAGVSFVL
jgi:surface antigen